MKGLCVPGGGWAGWNVTEHSDIIVMGMCHRRPDLSLWSGVGELAQVGARGEKAGGGTDPSPPSGG